jgi:hypothetical protein
MSPYLFPDVELESGVGVLVLPLEELPAAPPGVSAAPVAELPAVTPK